MFESITKYFGLDKIAKDLNLGFFQNVMPSLQKAYQVAKENGDKGFFNKAKIFMDSFGKEMSRLEAEKKQTTETTEQKAQQITSEAQDKMKTTVENLGTASQKALNTAMEVANDTYNKGISGAAHCWDWVSKIYEKAGVKRKQVFSSLGKYDGKNCGEAHAGEEEYASIQPGDHIFYNLETKREADYEEKMKLYAEGKLKKKPELKEAVDSRGNHSAVFIKWIDESNKIAQLASGSHGTKWKLHDNPVDFNKMPVTRIFKPVLA